MLVIVIACALSSRFTAAATPTAQDPFSESVPDLFKGVAVDRAISTSDFPLEVESGSIVIRKEIDKKAMMDFAKISKAQATDIAVIAVPGHVVTADLEDDNGFLVWEVEMLSTDTEKKLSLMIDAGNGRLLAVQPDD
jgi:hypothetical protein